MTTQTINLDILNVKPSEAILARYGETGRTIELHAYNSSTGDDIDLGDMTAVKFQLYKPDGNFIIDTPTISHKNAVITLTEQITASYGTGYIDLKLTDSQGVLYTCHATITIDTPVSSDVVIESRSLVDGYIFPDDFQLKLTAGEAIYFSGEDNRTINARATSLEAGDGLSIDSTTISINSDTLSKINDVDNKQDILTPGEGISIEGDKISCTVSSPDWELLGTLTYTVANAQAHVELTESFNSLKELLLVITQQSNGALWATQLLRTGDLFVNQEIYFPISTNTSIRSTSFTFTSNNDLKCTYSGEGANKVLKVYGR